MEKAKQDMLCSASPDYSLSLAGLKSSPSHSKVLSYLFILDLGPHPSMLRDYSHPVLHSELIPGVLWRLNGNARD